MNVADNCLQALPADLSGMRKMKILWAYGNQVQQIPDSVLRLPSLECEHSCHRHQPLLGSLSKPALAIGVRKRYSTSEFKARTFYLSGLLDSFFAYPTLHSSPWCMPQQNTFFSCHQQRDFGVEPLHLERRKLASFFWPQKSVLERSSPPSCSVTEIAALSSCNQTAWLEMRRWPACGQTLSWL